jgi:hypothetical protein
MGLLNLGILSTNVGDNSGDNRNNDNSSRIFVQETHGGRGMKHRSSHEGPRKSDCKRDCR